MEPDSSSLFQCSSRLLSPDQAARPPELALVSLEREGCQRNDGMNGTENSPGPTVSSTAAPRRCTAADPFWVAGAPGIGHARNNGAAANSRGLAGVPLRCLGDVVDAADREFELEVPEAELSTVHIETWEQRLDWRSFLSEAVASSRARQLFKAFDVEAEPPQYARPPPSSPMSAAGSSGFRQSKPGRAAPPPRCVAPSGAGWSPAGAASSALGRAALSRDAQLYGPL